MFSVRYFMLGQITNCVRKIKLDWPFFFLMRNGGRSHHESWIGFWIPKIKIMLDLFSKLMGLPHESGGQFSPLQSFIHFYWLMSFLFGRVPWEVYYSVMFSRLWNTSAPWSLWFYPLFSYFSQIPFFLFLTICAFLLCY